MKKLITIFGPSEYLPESALYKNAERLGTLLAEAGFAVVSGGYEGVMEAASKGRARQAERSSASLPKSISIAAENRIVILQKRSKSKARPTG